MSSVVTVRAASLASCRCQVNIQVVKGAQAHDPRQSDHLQQHPTFQQMRGLQRTFVTNTTLAGPLSVASRDLNDLGWARMSWLRRAPGR